MENSKVVSALLIAVVGLIVPAVLAAYLIGQGQDPEKISTLIGLFTSVVGTMVGAFLGVQVGSAGKKEAEDVARRALAALPPDVAARALHP